MLTENTYRRSQEFEHRIAHKMQTTGLNYYVSDTVVTARYAVHSASTQQAGVDRIIGWEIVELKAGKIGAPWPRVERTARRRPGISSGSGRSRQHGNRHRGGILGLQALSAENFR
jgi:hypothetical protein